MTEHDDIDWARVEALFPDLLDTPPEQRARFLDRHCKDAPALRRELEAMLASSERATVFDRVPQVRTQDNGDAAPMEPLAADTRIGAWRIVRMIGRGGMGEVYLAERADGGFAQQAAIKLLHGDAARHAQRFEEERRILAQLSHPNIARLLDGGVHGERAWMAMEFVEGRSITEHCRERALSLPARLKLFHQVCAAVAHAHASLVIHRDLKPSNILVNDTGQVKLLDFGIAKLIGPNAAALATHTTAFTPDHAAPEQVEGGPITIATDTYALGVVLYEMLGGRLPWSFGDTPLSRAIDRLLREDPPPVSKAAAEVDAGAVPAQELQGDLDAIVARCLRRLPQDRYATVQALQDDIDRHTRREPVLARQGGGRYVARLWLRRHRVLASAIAIAGIALLAGTGVALWQAGIAKREAAHARAQQRIAEMQRAQVAVQANSSLAVQELLMQMFSHAMAADSGKGTSVSDVVQMLEMMGGSSKSLDDAARAQLFLRLAKLGMISGNVDAAGKLIDRARPLVAQSGGARPRLLAQQLDAQLTLAVATHASQRMLLLGPPLMDLLDALPQPLDPEMQEIRFSTLRAWGWGLDQLGRAGEAVAVKQQALRAIEQRFGSDSERTRTAQSDLARALALAGRYSEAARLSRALLADDKNASAMSRITDMVYLAQALRQSQHGLPEALRLLREAQALAGQDRGLPAMYRTWVHAVQAEVLLEQGDLAAATALLRSTAALRSATGIDGERGAQVSLLSVQSDLAWAQGDAATAARHAQSALDFMGRPNPDSSSEQQKFLALRLRLRLLRAQATALPQAQLHAQVAGMVRDLDSLPVTQRSIYLAIAAETLRLGGMQQEASAMAKRAVTAADAMPEPNPRQQQNARRQLQAASQT